MFGDLAREHHLCHRRKRTQSPRASPRAVHEVSSTRVSRTLGMACRSRARARVMGKTCRVVCTTGNRHDDMLDGESLKRARAQGCETPPPALSPALRSVSRTEPRAPREGACGSAPPLCDCRRCRGIRPHFSPHACVGGGQDAAVTGQPRNRRRRAGGSRALLGLWRFVHGRPGVVIYLVGGVVRRLTVAAEPHLHIRARRRASRSLSGAILLAGRFPEALAVGWATTRCGIIERQPSIQMASNPGTWRVG